MKMYYVTCPLCGKFLFQTTPVDHMELECPKCHGKLNLSTKENQLVVDEYSGSIGTRNVMGKRMKGGKEKMLEQTILKEDADALLHF